MKSKNVITFGVIVAVAAAVVSTLIAAAAIALPTMISVNAQNMTGGGGAATAAQNQTETTSMTATNFTAQKTAISTVDTLPGHEMHQAVVVLPQRTDGKIWVGTLSWSASKPVEVRLLQNYDANVKPDAAHGKPVTAPFAQGESAISLLLQTNGAGTVPSYNAGSMNFAASQVAFHTLGGVPFSVTYTVDAEAKSLTS
jgi:opacity protein-like surface antigen